MVLKNNDKALGILFHLNINKEEREFTPYEWDENAIINLIKNIGKRITIFEIIN